MGRPMVIQCSASLPYLSFRSIRYHFFFFSEINFVLFTPAIVLCDQFSPFLKRRLESFIELETCCALSCNNRHSSERKHPMNVPIVYILSVTNKERLELTTYGSDKMYTVPNFAFRLFGQPNFSFAFFKTYISIHRLFLNVGIGLSSAMYAEAGKEVMSILGKADQFFFFVFPKVYSQCGKNQSHHLNSLPVILLIQ